MSIILAARTGAITCVVATCIAGLLRSAGLWPSDLSPTGMSMGYALAAVTLVPLIETAMLLATIRLVQICWPRMSGAAVGLCSASALALLHGIKWWGVPLIVVVPFFFFAQPFLDQALSAQDAFKKSALAHAFHNGYALLISWLGLALSQ